MPTPTVYNEAYHDDWVWSLTLKGATDDEIASAFGISVRTLHRWKKQHPSFYERMKEGKEIADAKVERCLFERATGYETTEVVSFIDVDAVSGRQSITGQKATKKQIPPDTMAIMYWLNNRQRKHWSQRQEVELSADEEGAEVHIYLPANGRDESE